MGSRLSCPFCEKEFSVPEEWLDSQVQCPACNQSFRAHSPSVGGEPGAGPVAELPYEDDEEDIDDYELALDEEPAPEPVESSATPSATECPECGAPLLEDGLFCQQCRYHLGLKRKLAYGVDIEEPSKETGVRRWFGEQLTEDTDTSELLLYAWALLLLILIAVSLAFHPWAWLVTVPILIAAAAAQWLWSRQRTDEVSLLPSGPLSRFVWNLTLKYHRTVGWRNFGDLRRLHALGLREPELGDAELENTPEYETLEVLDAEGSQLTDASVPRILQMRKLQYLVLRGTRISLENAEEIQRRLPNAWIWF